MTMSDRKYIQAVDAKRRAMEKRYVPLIRRALNRQVQEIISMIRPDNMYAVDPMPSREGIEKLFVDLYQKVGVAFANDVYSEIKNGTKADPTIPGFQSEAEKIKNKWKIFLRNFARTEAADRITSITGETRKQALRIIKATIDKGVEEGIGALRIAENIEKQLNAVLIPMNYWRALRIARTEVIGAANLGSMVGARDTGEEMEKRWISMIDNKTRPDHIEMNGRRVGLHDKFDVGGVMMDYPGDQTAPPEQVINCRCTVAFKVKKIDYGI